MFIQKIKESLIQEISPPGWSGTVRAMKDKEGMSSDKAFKLAWWQYKHGHNSHIKPESGHPGASHVSREVRKARDQAKRA